MTVLHPFCPTHARAALGVEVRRSAVRDACGLFAARGFRPGDLICPYLGSRRLPCPHSRGAPPASTGYDIELDTAARRVRYDASCRRSYAAMCNHHAPQRPRPNAAFVVTAVRASELRQLDAGWRARPTRPYRVDGSELPVRTAPDVLRHFGRHRPSHVGLGDAVLWLQAVQGIPAGAEITVDYGPDAADIIAWNHATAPPLC
jgi:hypothetical protein